MKLLKPSWVNHDDKPIFSVDIHPTGKRFATGGQGADSGRVVVWNLNSVLYESVEVDPNVPRMLCQMNNHYACVNCVRWSNAGKYLASGGDDKLVMVWGLMTTAGTAGKLQTGKAETWRCLKTLRGHAGDVLDLAWSPLDKWLASCSVDNTIIVWNAENLPEMVCVLNGHTGLVKGVAWDPVGKYLASQSDDKSLRVWKTTDWSPETIITEPFEECGGTTHVLRLSWSPDGQYVLSAHAMNGGGPTAQVVERDGWRCDKDFVGHRKAVTCARFNNNIFVKEGKKCCCAAVGSRDRALSIWLTSLKRPLVVIHDLFADSVLDLSWSSDGLNLLACSSDGTVACIQFSNQEIGTPLTIEEKNAFYEKIYGKCLANEPADLSSNLLIECPEILLAREKQDAKKEAAKEEGTPRSDKSQPKPALTPSPISAQTSPTPLRPMDRQIETRTSDGKRRITPVFIPLAQADANESLGSQPGGPENCFSTSSQSKSRIRVERRDDIIIHPNVSNHALPLPTTHAAKPNDNGLDPRLRKRDPPPLPGPSLENLLPKASREDPRPFTATPIPVPALGTAGPVVRAAGPLRLQAINKACNTIYGPLTKLQLFNSNSALPAPIWETFLGSAVTCITCSERWAGVSCADGTLHAWRLNKTRAHRALPPVALKCQAAKLTLTGDVLAVVTTEAEIIMWDLPTASCVVQPLSFRNLMQPGDTVSNCTMLEDGSPLVSLNSDRVYIYSKQLFSWVVWANSVDPVWRASVGATPSGTPHSACPLYPPLKAPRMHISNARFASVHRVGAAHAWLEGQVAACLHLRLGKDYRFWIVSLFDHLVMHGTEEQLRTLLDDMLGPAHCTSFPKDHTVLGLSKYEILEEMLSLLVRDLKWQRLYIEYCDQLTCIKEAKAQLTNGH